MNDRPNVEAPAYLGSEEREECRNSLAPFIDQAGQIKKGMAGLFSLQEEENDLFRSLINEQAGQLLTNYHAFVYSWKAWLKRLSSVRGNWTAGVVHDSAEVMDDFGAAMGVLKLLIAPPPNSKISPGEAWKRVVYQREIYRPCFVEHFIRMARGVTDEALGEVQKKEVDLALLARDVTEIFSAMQTVKVEADDDRRAVIVYEGPPELLVNGWGDGLYRVIFNLVSNAVKAVSGLDDPQQRRVTVCLEPTFNGTELAVENPGPGIDWKGIWESATGKGLIGKEEAYDKQKARGLILEFGVSGFGQSGGRGSGLGLAMCRAIMERHGGKIEFSDDLSGNTVFRAVLPQTG